MTDDVTGGSPIDQLIDELFPLARSLARTAGDRAAAGRAADVSAGNDRATLGATTKSTRTDIVTRHDRAAESLIVEGLVGARPGDAIVGEEGTNRPGTSGVTWFVDPIDGTTNFAYGLPLWSTSIGARDGDGPLVGVVYVPMTGELFAAARGRGATRNEDPIAASSETDIALALVSTGFGYEPDRRRRQAGQFQELAPVVRDLRRTGSAAIDLSYTAAGFLDAYYEEGLNAWDMAAGQLIATEAGCRVGDYSGGPARPDQLLAAAPGLFDALSSRLVSVLHATSDGPAAHHGGSDRA